MMARTDVEMKLLQIRQDLYDILVYLKTQPIVSIQPYRRILGRYLACEFMLKEYRFADKFKDSA